MDIIAPCIINDGRISFTDDANYALSATIAASSSITTSGQWQFADAAQALIVTFKSDGINVRPVPGA